MCIESLDTYLEYHEIQLQTKLFLEEHLIINDILEELLENEDEVYVLSLKGDKKNKFILNLKQHFEWIKDKCLDSTIKFKDYDSNFEPSLKKAYCHFYYIAKNKINQERIPKQKQIRENLEDYFCAFIKRYCVDETKHCDIEK